MITVDHAPHQWMIHTKDMNTPGLHNDSSHSRTSISPCIIWLGQPMAMQMASQVCLVGFGGDKVPTIQSSLVIMVASHTGQRELFPINSSGEKDIKPTRSLSQ